MRLNNWVPDFTGKIFIDPDPTVIRYPDPQHYEHLSLDHLYENIE